MNKATRPTEDLGSARVAGDANMYIDNAAVYHWWELPKVLFLSRQNHACRDKTFGATNVLSRQT